QTEKLQEVDQQQAEREKKRLEQLVEETEQQLEKLREESTGNRSYAIVPYTGPHGTHRKPVYIECSGDGVTIQPEGIQFSRSDFSATSWPGNPLAAALRASREYLQDRHGNGDFSTADAYPLLIVRPSGI